MLLTEDDLRELTGYKRYSCQIKWLANNGIKYLVGRDGKPRVCESQIQSLIGSQNKPSKRRAEPNEDALNDFMGLN